MPTTHYTSQFYLYLMLSVKHSVHSRISRWQLSLTTPPKKTGRKKQKRNNCST